MKPKNKYQERVMRLSKALKPITPRQLDWAIKNCFSRTVYFTPSSAWCNHCGGVFAVKNGVDGQKTTCPHCGIESTLKSGRKRKEVERWYYTILTTNKGFQVCRHFLISKTAVRGAKTAVICDEVGQSWINTSGKEIIVFRPRKASFYCDLWDTEKPMEIRQRSNATWSQYDIDAPVYNRVALLPEVKRNGFTIAFDKAPANRVIKAILKDREAELLLKNKQYALLAHKINRGLKELPHQPAVRIAVRNKYLIEDASLWLDYVGMLEYLGKDLRNPALVCPKDVRAAHDHVAKAYRKEQDKRRLQEDIAKAAMWEEKYRKQKGCFFGICLSNGDLTIRTIQSVAEMAQEGAAMHHCVFDMGYYKRPNSLILSARDKAGKRIETIEVDLTTYKVVQSRGPCNSNTKFHNDIINLVEKNMKKIQSAAC